MNKRQLYPYQEEVAQHILNGQSIILQAPTGAGKTTAALLPYLHARQHLDAAAFPRKCIYSVPLKVLANQFEDEYRKLMTQYGWDRELQVKIQTGGRPDDTRFEGDLIFTTIDQTLSSFLSIPHSLSQRQANLNAGAILSSYLVFDELHLYDPDTTLPTTLNMLHMLKEITPFIVMTATFSSTMLQTLADQLGATVVPDPQKPATRQAMMHIGSQKGKQRRFYPQDTPLTAAAILSHTAPRSLCICNTVHSAQRLYHEITAALEAAGDKETVVKLLHSRFYKQDRDQKEAWIRTQFGIDQANYQGPRLIQIATQVIEVGVDATCDVLHTELSPAASLLQRAGRCARRAYEQGRVYIYLPRDDQGQPYYAPYGRDQRSHRLCENTWATLNTPQFTDTHISFAHEQALIDHVHTPIDQEILREIQQMSHSRRQKMLMAMRNPPEGRSLAPELIRDINNRFIFIHPDPNHDERLQTNPWAYDGFSLYPTTITAAYHTLTNEVDSDTPWLMQGAHALTDDEAPARQGTQYRWFNLTDKTIFTSAVIAIHPHLVQYDDDCGFRFALSPGASPAPRRPQKQKPPRYSYQRETYLEHITGLYHAYRQPIDTHPPLQANIAYISRRLEETETYQLKPGQLDEVIRLIFVCHDLGKLSQEWQAWAHQWQQQLSQRFGPTVQLPPDYMAAHTDYNPYDPKQVQAQKQMPPRPHHAGESGMAAAVLLDELYGDNEALFKAALTAIFRHHNPTTNSYSGYRHHPAAPEAITTSLAHLNLPTNWANHIEETIPAAEPLNDLLVDFDNRHLTEVWLYFLLVRVLRLADQRSQMK